MPNTFIEIFKIVALLNFYIAIGFLLGKKKIIGENAGKTLASILTWVVMPFYSVYSMSKGVTIDKIGEYGRVFLAGVVIAAVCMVLCIPLSKLFVKSGYARNIYKYLLYSPNLGYFGFPLVEAAFGAETLATYIIFTFPMSLGINTFGYLILTDKSANGVQGKDTDDKSELLKRIFSPPMIGTFVGVAVAFLPITLPETVYDFLSPAKDCMRALAMLLTGIVLSKLNVKTLFTSKKTYVVGVVRLIVYPVVFGGVTYLLYLLGLDKEIFILTVCLMALPAGMNVVVFPESIGMDGREGAQACFISYLMVMVTLPFVFFAISALVGV